MHQKSFWGLETITDTFTADISSFVPVNENNQDQITTDNLSKRFLDLFTNRFSSVVRREGSLKWLEMSRFHNLTDAEIIEALEATTKLQRGYRFDPNTKFLVLHIPADSPYHNPDSINELRRNFEELQVKPRHYQFDEDWYLYIYLKSEGSSTRFSGQLEDWCRAQGYVLSEKSLTVHPSDSALPFPLQNGFTWMNERCQLLVRRGELSLEEALSFFLQDAGKNSVETDEFMAGLKRICAAAKIDSPEQEPLDQVISLTDEAEHNLTSPDQGNQADATGTNDDASVPDNAKVVAINKRRTGDERVSLHESARNKTDFDQNASGRSELEEESQLLLFLAPKQAPKPEQEAVAEFACDNSPEPLPAKKRRSDRRARQQSDSTQPGSGKIDLI